MGITNELRGRCGVRVIRPIRSREIRLAFRSGHRGSSSCSVGKLQQRHLCIVVQKILPIQSLFFA